MVVFSKTMVGFVMIRDLRNMGKNGQYDPAKTTYLHVRTLPGIIYTIIMEKKSARLPMAHPFPQPGFLAELMLALAEMTF